MLEQVRRLREQGVSAEELERYKEMVRCGMEVMCDSPEQLADWLGRQELLLPAGRTFTPEQYVRRQEALTLDELQGIVGEVLGEERANLAVVGPFGEKQHRQLERIFPAEHIETAHISEGVGTQ